MSEDAKRKEEMEGVSVGAGEARGAQRGAAWEREQLTPMEVPCATSGGPRFRTELAVLFFLGFCRAS